MHADGLLRHPSLHHSYFEAFRRALWRDWRVYRSERPIMATFFQSVYVPRFSHLSPRYPRSMWEVWCSASLGQLLLVSVHCHCLKESASDLVDHPQTCATLTVIHPPRRQGFGRANTKSNTNLKAAAANGASTSNTNIPPLPPLTNSPSVSSSMSMDSNYSDGDGKRFFNEKYAKCSVKGNFLTLAAQPKNVELGEWLAHQCRGQQFRDPLVQS